MTVCTSSVSESFAMVDATAEQPALDFLASGAPITLLTGGTDRHYVFGLAMALVAKGIPVEIIGSDLLDSPEMHFTPGLTFLNLQGNLNSPSFATKAFRLLRFYCRLVRYAWSAQPQVFHILWNNKLWLLDRTVLMFYYKALGKKMVFTAHNVNAGKRDSRDSVLNRFSLKNPIFTL